MPRSGSRGPFLHPLPPVLPDFVRFPPPGSGSRSEPRFPSGPIPGAPSWPRGSLRDSRSPRFPRTGTPGPVPPPGAALAPEPRPVLGSGSGKFPCRGASPGARLGPFCPRDGLGAPARRAGLSSWRPRPNPAAPARPRPWLNFDGAEVGVYLPDCRETLGWGRPGCFATAADSGGLKPDRALMWPYLGLRESPRNLLREAPRGLGEADWVYFIFSLIPKPRHWGSRSHRAAAGRLGLGEVWGSQGAAAPTVVPQCPPGIPGCVQVSPALPGVTPQHSAVPQGSSCRAGSRWDRASSALEAHRRRSQSTVDGPSGAAALPGQAGGVGRAPPHPAPLPPSRGPSAAAA